MRQPRTYRINELTHKRLKMLAVRKGCTIGAALLYLLDKCEPMSPEDQLRLLSETDTDD